VLASSRGQWPVASYQHQHQLQQPDYQGPRTWLFGAPLARRSVYSAHSVGLGYLWLLSGTPYEVHSTAYCTPYLHDHGCMAAWPHGCMAAPLGLRAPRRVFKVSTSYSVQYSALVLVPLFPALHAHPALALLPVPSPSPTMR
jgi:hypothetical protein